MLRIANWGGLLPSVSPYSMPPGGAQEQVNFTLEIPGQLTSRSGMAPVTFAQGTPPAATIEQIFPVTGRYGEPSRALMIDSAGGIHFLSGAGT